MTMTTRRTYRAKAIAMKADRAQRNALIGFALLVTGLLIGQLLILTSP